MELPGTIASHCAATHKFKAKTEKGFSVHDLLVTMTIVSVTATSVVSVRGMMERQRITTEVNSLVGMLALTRSEAVKRGAAIVLCPTTDSETCDRPSTDYTSWGQGMMLFVDTDNSRSHDASEPVVRYHGPTAPIVIKTSNYRTKAVYEPDGTALGGSNATWTVCGGSGNTARYVVLLGTGRVRTSDKPADGRADSTYERCP